MNLRALSFGLLAAAALVGWTAMEPYSFAGGSRITVEGTSTVHDWHCGTTQATGSLSATPATSGLSALTGLTVTVPVNALDCGNGTMNGKMRDALGASAIRFVASDARVGTANGGRFALEANGQLTIHGTTRTQRIQAQGQDLGNGRYRFTGSVPVTMSQFGVTPPTAMMGALHTGDRVTVNFDVTIAR